MRTYNEVRAHVAKLRSHEYDAWRRNPNNRDEVALLDSGGTAGVQATPRGAARRVVIRPCANCGKDSPVAEDFTGQVFCSDECIKASDKAKEQIVSVAVEFQNDTPTFYSCPYNTSTMVNEMVSRKREFTVDNKKRLFRELYAEERLLPTLSVKDIEQMTPEQYRDREAKDPMIGGWKEKIEKGEVLLHGRKSFDTPEPETSRQSNQQALERMAESDRRARAAAGQDRYTSQAFLNGLPVEPPKTQFQQFRNGRPVR
jgi:hypothetical protein